MLRRTSSVATLCGLLCSCGGGAPLVCDPPARAPAFGKVSQLSLRCHANDAVSLHAASTETGVVKVDVPGSSLSSGDSVDVPVTVRFPPVGPLPAVVVGVEGGEAVTVPLPDVAAPNWERVPAIPACAADGEAPLLDQVLDVAGLTRDDFGILPSDLHDGGGDVPGYLDDPFRLSWFPALREHPARAGCFGAEAVGPLDAAAAGDHPVASMIRHAAALLDREASGPALAAGAADTDLAAVIAELCGGPAGSCSEPRGELPADLSRALAPVVAAIGDGLLARKAMAKATNVDDDNPGFFRDVAGNLLLGFAPTPDPRTASVRKALLGTERKDLYAAAARIAFAVESTDWSAFAGRKGIAYDLVTDAGVIRVRDGDDDIYPEVGEDVLLLVDLGGDDVHRDAAASNTSDANAVSVLIDVAGDDVYGYDEVPSPNDREGLLPSDAAGRDAGISDADCDAFCNGPISLSTVSRQGAARWGIAMLFDLGGDDSYRSLRASQGYGQLGVGVLLDAGGDDRYVAEAQSQGAAQFGIGLAVDLGGGKDFRRAFTEAQGFGYVGGAGIVYDDGGDDTYDCDHGDKERGGIRVYGSPQTVKTGNSSFCQGAGFGARMDSVQTYLSGGIGILRDRTGDDVYGASVFAQGTGYWQGTGILADGDGADRYDAAWYIQGAAAHYSVGLLLDGGDGDDVFDGEKAAWNMSLGSGHDFSLGVLIDEAGNDTYNISSLAAGSSNCNGLGLFVDDAGDDTYVATGDYNEGMGNISGECYETRSDARSIGVMIDGGGNDRYQGDGSDFPRPDNDTTWSYVRSDHPGERGGGLDGSGETGLHAP